MGINLLPPKYHAYSKIKKKGVMVISPGIIIILCLILGGIGYYFYRIDLENELAVLKEQLADTDLVSERTKYKQETLEALVDLKVKANENLKLWHSLLETVASNKANQLWIKEIKNEEGSLVIKGEASDLEVLGDLLQEINQLVWLENIEIKVMEKIGLEEILLKNEIELDLFQRIEDREEIIIEDKLKFLLVAQIKNEWQLPEFKGGEP